MVKQIASFSTGLSSALMVERLLERYGRDLVEIVMMDTTIEDSDNYRFMHDMEKRWKLKIVGLLEGRTPYMVAEDHGIIPNNTLAPCTLKLKIEPFIDYLKGETDPFVINIGFDFSEVHRCAATDKNYGKLGYKVDYPLLWKPVEERSYSDVCRNDWKIEPPRMYALGYTHANCGGMCVKQGKGDWIRTLLNFPDRYKRIEAWEGKMRLKNPGYALVRTMVAGKSSPVSLKQLREEYESKQVIDLEDLDGESSCVVCGTGDLVVDNG